MGIGKKNRLKIHINYIIKKRSGKVERNYWLHNFSRKKMQNRVID